MGKILPVDAENDAAMLHERGDRDGKNNVITFLDRQSSSSSDNSFVEYSWKIPEFEKTCGGSASPRMLNQVVWVSPNDPDPLMGKWLKEGCWAGLFPSGADVSKIDPIKKTTADQPLTKVAPMRWIEVDSEEGSFQWSMDSKQRVDMEVILFSGGFDSPVPLKRTGLEVTDKEEPGQIRLALTGRDEEMLVQWNSANGDLQKVKWGLEKDNLDRETTEKEGDVETISASDLCGEPATSQGFFDPGFFHAVSLDLSGIEEGTEVFYSVGEGGQWTDVTSFRVPKQRGAQKPVKAIIVADMGETYNDGSHYHWEEPDARNTTSHMASFASSLDADLTIHAGDLSYATGYESEWDKFLTAIEPLSSRLPYMTGKGNHEQDWAFPPPGAPPTHYKGRDSGGECGVATDLRFRMPTTERDGNRREGWWSVDVGSVHFTMTNTEMPCGKDSDMYAWLDGDLGGVNRTETPWVVVLGHRQMWDSWGSEKNLVQMEPLLIKHRVDLSIYGHIHYAEQSCPMEKGKCVGEANRRPDGYDAPVHLVVGNGGQSLSRFPPLKPSYNVFQQHEWGFSVLEAHNATHLTFSFYGDAPMDSEPPLRHSFTLVRAFPREVESTGELERERGTSSSSPFLSSSSPSPP